MSDAGYEPVPFGALMQRGGGFMPTIWNSGAPMADVVHDDAYARGLADGQQFAAAAFEADRLAMQQLVADAHKGEAGNIDELGVLIRETVLRLVEQIVGNVEIDHAFLSQQIANATALISEADNARTLWLNTDDHALMGRFDMQLETKVDDRLARGNCRIDCSTGWIEHGIALGIEKLRELLGAGAKS